MTASTLHGLNNIKKGLHLVKQWK